MLIDRQEHENILSKLLTEHGYNLKRVPTEHAGGKWRLGYQSFTGISQNIELDLNGPVPRNMGRILNQTS